MSLNPSSEQIGKLESWVSKKVDETNLFLFNAKIDDFGLAFHKHELSNFCDHEYSGSVTLYLLNRLAQPTFLNSEEQDKWERLIRDMQSNNIFNENSMFQIAINMSTAYIRFKADSESSLYSLTPMNIGQITQGFEIFRKYVGWNNLLVEEYDKIVEAHNRRFDQYIRDMDVHSRNIQNK